MCHAMFSVLLVLFPSAVHSQNCSAINNGGLPGIRLHSLLRPEQIVFGLKLIKVMIHIIHFTRLSIALLLKIYHLELPCRMVVKS